MTLEDFIAGYDFRWDDMPNLVARADAFFDRLLADVGDFTDYLETALADPVRRSMCEIDEIRTKLVLHDHPQGAFRVRLHVWQDNPPGIIHTHRFPYVARVLRGGYRHALYTYRNDLLSDRHAPLDEKFLALADAPEEVTEAVAAIRPAYFSTISPGQTYAQGEDGTLSSTEPVPGTISLFVRGPTSLPRAFQWDRATNVVIWKRGAADSAPADVARIRLQEDALSQALDTLHGAGLLSRRMNTLVDA